MKVSEFLKYERHGTSDDYLQPIKSLFEDTEGFPGHENAQYMKDLFAYNLSRYQIDLLLPHLRICKKCSTFHEAAEDLF